MGCFQSECFEFGDTRPIIVAKERGKQFILKNASHKKVCKYLVDGCLIKDGTSCDYLLLIVQDRHAYLVELKGSNLEHAIRQIEESIIKLKDILIGYKVSARIIIGKVRSPQIKYSEEIKIKEKLKKLDFDLRIKGTECEETV